MESSNSHMLGNLYKRLFILFTILVGLALNLFLIKTITVFKSKAATPVLIYLSPTTASIPPDADLKVMINSNVNYISFLSVTIHFDPMELRLNANVNTANSPLKGVISVSSIAEANQTGNINIVLVQMPGNVAPSGVFEIATLSFTTSGTQSGVQTDVTVVEESTQIVDNLNPPNELVFNTAYAAINSAVPGGGTSSQSDLAKGECPDMYIYTAIGCIPYGDRSATAKFFISWGLGIASGIALVLIVIAGYMIISSQGDPKRLQAGKELLTAAIMGLMLLIFSTFILRVIGVDILQIPGL